MRSKADAVAGESLYRPLWGAKDAGRSSLFSVLVWSSLRWSFISLIKDLVVAVRYARMAPYVWLVCQLAGWLIRSLGCQCSFLSIGTRSRQDDVGNEVRS